MDFDVTPLYILMQRKCIRKRWLFGKNGKLWFLKVYILMGERFCFSSSSYKFAHTNLQFGNQLKIANSIAAKISKLVHSFRNYIF